MQEVCMATFSRSIAGSSARSQRGNIQQGIFEGISKKSDASDNTIFTLRAIRPSVRQGHFKEG
jgi:hypothetical protein